MNLGIGLPTLVADFIPADREIVLHSENGVLGVGPGARRQRGRLGSDQCRQAADHPGDRRQLCRTTRISFLMIRGGHLDLALLGAFEVSEKGDLANWTTDDPGFPPGVGGAMDLAVGRQGDPRAGRAHDQGGAPRIRRRCQYPLTAAAVVRRIYTDLAVIDVTAEGLVVRELVEDIEFPALQAKTEALHCTRLPT